MSGKDKVNILLVDDQPAKLLSYEAVLGELDENLLMAPSAREAFEHLLKAEIAVVLVDVCMPDLDGFELARMIREHPRFQKTAIIFISAILLTEPDFLRGYESGAVDYVPVPVVPQILRAKVKIFAELYRRGRELETLNRELERRVAERTAALEASTAELRRSEERLRLAFDAAQMGWWDYDFDSDRVTWSPSLVRIMGFEPQSFGSTLDGLLTLVHTEDRERFLLLFDEQRTESDSRCCELRFIRPDGSIRWSLTSGQVLRDAQSRPLHFTGLDLDITTRKATEERQALLMRELDHRARNLLAVVQSVLHLSRAESMEELVAAVDGRVRALARAHSLLSEARWKGVDLARLVQEEIAPFSARQAEQFRGRGPEILIDPTAAQSIALALHELATNAVKHGALSVSQGSVRLTWHLESDFLVMRWAETGGPAVSKPTREGFGTKVITTSVEHQLNGQVSLGWLAEGLNCVISIPRASLEKPGIKNAGPSVAADSALPHSLSITGGRILLVEDETLIGLMIKDTLTDLGFYVAGPVGTIAQALAILEMDQFDGAILDVNLGGDSVYPVAEALSARGIPFAFMTGYAQEGIDSRYAHVARLEKPIEPQILRRLFVETVIGGKTLQRQTEAESVTAALSAV